jgi:tetratricopeptide (TPR) repeat protein
LHAFEQALARGSFAKQEIREQLTRAAQQLARDEELPAKLAVLYPELSQAGLDEKAGEVRQRFVALAEEELLAQMEEKPDDARVLVFVASFYRALGEPGAALSVLEHARELSPQKQHILYEVGFAHLQLSQFEQMKAAFREAFELAQENKEARIYYAVAAIYARDEALVDELITEEYEEAFVEDDFVASAYYNTDQTQKVLELFRKRIEYNAGNLEMRLSLASFLRDVGRPAEAIAVIEEAMRVFPDFEAQGRQVIQQIRAGQ